jgi:putative endonuclease
MTVWFCYILECEDGTLYTGLTNDPARRWRDHLAGRAARYTRQHPPQRLAYLERHTDRGTAMRREIALKRMGRPAKLALIAATPPLQEIPEGAT